jgi:hypothetical protein
MASIITLTTDFGTTDWFVGVMKGVVARLAPKANVIDLTHAAPPGDIRGAAFALATSYNFFPRGTVHVAVVDPGVGSARKVIAVRTANYFFVGPDNGVLSLALAKEKVRAIHALENERYFLHPVSQTFHGRDIFAAVAAHLVCSVPIQKFGPPLKNFVSLAWPVARGLPAKIEGEVVYVDRFGNAITNIDSETIQILGRSSMDVFLNHKRVCPVAGFYEAVPKGKPVALLGSNGLLEIAVHGGSAAKRLGLRPGVMVEVRPKIGQRRFSQTNTLKY